MNKNTLLNFFRKISENKKVLTFVFIIYLVISFMLILKHEIWVDEAQAWQMGKELSVLGVFKQMKFEGHSCLWHLILMPFAKLNFPPITMNIINWMIVSISVYLLLFHAKWNIIVKIAVIFNPAYIYYISVFSRCYSLIPLFLSLLVIIYPKRKKHPFWYANILGLLAHTHIMMCSIVGILAILFLIEYIRYWKEINKKEFFYIIFILGIYFILLALQVLPSLNNCAILSNGENEQPTLYSVSSQLSSFFFPSFISNIWVYFVCFVFLLMVIFTYIYNKKNGFVFLIFMIVFFVIHMFWPWVLPVRIAIAFIVFAFLNFYNKSILVQITLLVLPIGISYQNQYIISYDYYGDYSDSKNVASYINQNIEDQSLMIFINSNQHPSAVPYIKKDIDYYNFKLDSFQTYITWEKKNYYDLNYNKVVAKLEEFNDQYDHIYLMRALPNDALNEKDGKVIDKLILHGYIEFCYSTSYNAYMPSEIFYIYQYK